MSVVNEALADLKAIKEAATIAAKNRLVTETSSRFEAILKEEIQKKLALKESMIEQQEDSMVADNPDSMKLKVDDVSVGSVGSDITETNNIETEITESDENVESDDEDINIDELKEAMEELNIDDENIVDEHDMNLNIKFDENGIQITDINAGGEEFDDIDLDLDSIESDDLGSDDLGSDDIDLDSIDSDELDSIESDDLGSDDIDLGGEDSLDIDDAEGSEDVEGGEDEIELDFEGDDELDEEELDLDQLDLENINFDELDFEDEVEESLAHTMTHDNARQVGSEGNLNTDKERNLRPAVREGAEIKKLKANVAKLMKENKELVSLSKQFKDKVEKYKDQLFEMVFHNANLSHVNNLFVEHVTTVDEKINIVNKFNNVQTIEESKKLYTELKNQLVEGQKSKKTIEESVSKGAIVEENVIVKETTTYEDESVQKIKEMIRRIEGNVL